MAKKRKTLPKNFRELIEAKDIPALKEVFTTCEINAYHGYNKEPALSFFNIPDELVVWLVENGADINFRDATYQRTPLHLHAMRRAGRLKIFLELGADVKAIDRYGNTALHFAAGSFNLQNVQDLLEYGADPLAKNEDGFTPSVTPLEDALQQANNIDLASLVGITEILLKADTPITKGMRESVTRIGKNFEFHRANISKDFLGDADRALTKLYEIFNVTPVAKRMMHDGIADITVQEGSFLEQHNALWQLLIPSQGAAKTVQGEVIRITGRVQSEIYRNGGANWDKNYSKMLDALLAHFASQTPLEGTLLDEAQTLVAQVKKKGRAGDGLEEATRLCELAVLWVKNNPKPAALQKPNYNR